MWQLLILNYYQPIEELVAHHLTVLLTMMNCVSSLSAGYEWLGHTSKVLPGEYLCMHSSKWVGI